MATPIVVDDVVSIRCWNSFLDQAAVNTFNFQCISKTGVGASDQDLAGGFAAFFGTFYTTYMGNTAIHNGVQVYFLRRNGAKPSPVQDTSAAGVGTGGADTVPRNTAAIFKYKGFFSGPGSRGRVYLPFAATANVGPTADPIAAFDALVNAVAANLLVPTLVGTVPNQSTIVWVLARRPPSPGLVTTQEIIDARAAGKFGQMHKRGDYGKPNSSPI